jgi:hypothetical protein
VAGLGGVTDIFTLFKLVFTPNVPVPLKTVITPVAIDGFHHLDLI